MPENPQEMPEPPSVELITDEQVMPGESYAAAVARLTDSGGRLMTAAEFKRYANRGVLSTEEGGQPGLVIGARDSSAWWVSPGSETDGSFSSGPFEGKSGAPDSPKDPDSRPHPRS